MQMQLLIILYADKYAINMLLFHTRKFSHVLNVRKWKLQTTSHHKALWTLSWLLIFLCIILRSSGFFYIDFHEVIIFIRFIKFNLDLLIILLSVYCFYVFFDSAYFPIMSTFSCFYKYLFFWTFNFSFHKFTII